MSEGSAGRRTRVLTIERLVTEVGDRADPQLLLRGFVPPPRFADKEFASYSPRHPSQGVAVARLGAVGEALRQASVGSTLQRLLRRRRGATSGGIYLDGGFGVGKTHLLASLWNYAPGPKFYLSFDELMYFVGLLGPSAAAEAFAGARLIAVDEWELDDPGNLKLALAFLRGAIAGGSYVAVTSNTVPLDLGAGRFSQKDFRLEVEELASAFEILRVEGDDYRRRHLPAAGEALPGQSLRGRACLDSAADRGLEIGFEKLVVALGAVHPIRFREMARRLDCLVVNRIDPLPSLADALRWVHFVDSIYVSGTRFFALEEVNPGQIFTPDALAGPFGKKLLRCVSRMGEMLGGSLQLTGDS